MGLKLVAGVMAGGVGYVVGNNFDVMKTLAQINRNNTSSLSWLVSNIYINKGISGFYCGVQVNIMISYALNATKMGCYVISKELVSSNTGWSRKYSNTAFSSSCMAGLFITFTVAPMDMKYNL